MYIKKKIYAIDHKFVSAVTTLIWSLFKTQHVTLYGSSFNIIEQINLRFLGQLAKLMGVGINVSYIHQYNLLYLLAMEGETQNDNV